MTLNTIVTRDGNKLTERVWLLVDDVEAVTGVPLRVIQGGFQSGDGANASAGTHDRGDVLDLSHYGLSDAEAVAVVVALRRRNGCAWVRSPKYGWTKTSPHIHCVMRDSFYGLSPAALRQVMEYDAGYDGLSGSGRDPHPRPVQAHWEPAPPPVDTYDPAEDEPMTIVKRLRADGGKSWYLLHGKRLTWIGANQATDFSTLPTVTVAEALWSKAFAGYEVK